MVLIDLFIKIFYIQFKLFVYYLLYRERKKKKKKCTWLEG